MNEATSFSLLRKSSIIPKAIKSICIRSRCLLFVWSLQEVYVYEYKLTIVEGLPEFDGFEETLNIVNGVADVICSGDNIYILDKKGAIFLLDLNERYSKSVDDMDIFEASPDDEKCIQQNFIGNLENCEEILAVTEVGEGLATCSKYKETLFIQIWRLEPLEKIHQHSITDVSPSEEVFLSSNRVPISAELKREHFKFLPKKEQNVGLLLVGLSTGQVQAISYSKNNQINISTIISTPYPVTAINWIEDESRQCSTAVVVQLLHGVAMVLHENGLQALYLSGPVYKAMFNSSCMAYATTDGIDCVVTKLQALDEDYKYECSTSPLKGIRAMSKLPNTNLIMIGTQHKGIYWLNMSSPSVGDPTNFEVPENRLFDALLSSTVCLETICRQMETEDEILKAVALVKRAKMMAKYFAIFAKVYKGPTKLTNKIKVRVETSCDFIEFSNQIWRLELTIVNAKSSRTEIILKKLKKSFNCDNPINCEMEVGSIGIGIEIQCNMLAFLEANHSWLVFPLGKVQIDAGYLLTVVNRVPKLNVDLPSKTILSPTDANQKVDSVLTLTLSQSLLDDGLLFPKIFFNSSHRMLKEQWLCLKDNSTTSVNATIEDDTVYLKMDKSSSSLKISSSDTEICHHVKKAILSRIMSNIDVTIEERVYVETEAVRLSFEVAKLKMDLNPKTLKHFKEQIRSISKSLPT